MTKSKTRQSLINAIETIATTASKLGNEYVSGTPLANLSVKKIHYITLVKELNYPTITKLAQTLKVTKPTVTNTVHNLIKQGLIKKIQDQQDKRIYHLFLTDKGNNIYQKRKQISLYFSEIMFSCLTDKEIKIIQDIFNKILAHIQNQKTLSFTGADQGDLTNE